MGCDQRCRGAGADVARQLLGRGQLGQFRGRDRGLIRVGVALGFRGGGQKVQQLRLFGGVRRGLLGGFCRGILRLLCGQGIGLPLHRRHHVLAQLGGTAVKHTSGLLQAAGRLAGRVDVKDLRLRLFLGGHFGFLQVQNDLFGVRCGIHRGGVTGFASAKQHDGSSRF